MTTPTISEGDRSKRQTCCRCLSTVERDEPRITETFEFDDDDYPEGHCIVRHFHYCQDCAEYAGKSTPKAHAVAEKARLCATGCGLAAAPGDIYCSGCASASDRSAWA